MVNPAKAVFAAVVIFLAGAASGALAHHLAGQAIGRRSNPSPAGRPLAGGRILRLEFLRRAGNQLDLTLPQRARIDQILAEGQARMEKLWEPVAPQARDLLRDVRQRIETELTPPQRAKFTQLLKERGPRRPLERPESRHPGEPPRSPPAKPPAE